MIHFPPMKLAASIPLAASLPLAAAVLFLGCKGDRQPAAAGADNGSVYTTFYPTTYFAERIAGGLVPVVCPLPADADPIFWQPPREALAAYQQAALVVLNGASFEKWVDTASLPADRTVVAGDLPPEQLIRYENAVVHKHGPAGEHSHEGIDGHTWLDPEIARLQVETIVSAMAGRWPQHADAFDANAAQLLADLADLDRRLRATPPPPLLASHPAYNYLAKRYGWDIDNLDLDPEQMPTDGQVADIRARLAERPVKLLLWEGEPLPEIAARLESELGLESVLFSPCETTPESGDFLSAMEANIDRLANAGNP